MPEIAIVCQQCHRFVVRLTFSHGAITVGAILAAIILQDRVGATLIPLITGLIAAELLLLFTVRTLDRRMVLLIISAALIPVSIIAVAPFIGLQDELPTALLHASRAWIIAAVALGLAGELFYHWYAVGKQHQMSFWRIIGTYSVGVSAIALIAATLILFVPESMIPDDNLWRVFHHILNFRVAALYVWVGGVVIMALPRTFAQPINITPVTSWGPAWRWAHYVAHMSVARLLALGRELRDGAADIALMARVALAPVFRRALFLVALVALQAALCVTVEGYLNYHVARQSAAAVPVAVFVAILATCVLFWSATKATVAAIMSVAANTLSMGGLLLLLCSAVASWVWSAAELVLGRKVTVNWFALATIGLVVVVFAIALAGKVDRGKSRTSV